MEEARGKCPKASRAYRRCRREADVLVAGTYLRLIGTLIWGARGRCATPSSRRRRTASSTMAAEAEAERRRRKVKLLLTNILGTNGQPSVTHVPFFFVRITPCTTFPIEKVLFNLPLLGPIFHFWVANEHLHGNCYRSTCSGCRSPITTNGPFCSCNFGSFLMKHRSYDWQIKIHGDST
jgi:hypothetical protein